MPNKKLTEELSAVDAARAALKEHEGQLADAKDALDRAEADLAAPCDAPDLDAYRFEVGARRRVRDEAASAVVFLGQRAADARKVVALLEPPDLQEGVATARHAMRLHSTTVPLALAELSAFVTDPDRSIAAVLRELRDAHDAAEADAETLLDTYSIKTPPLSMADPEMHELVRLLPEEDSAAAWLRCAADVIDFIAASESRAKERARVLAQRQAKAARQYENECVQGRHGPDEEARARAAVSKELRTNMYPGRGALGAGAAGTRAELELQIAYQNAGLPRVDADQ